MRIRNLVSCIFCLMLMVGVVRGQSPSLFTQNSNLKLHEIVTRTQPYLDSLRAANNGVMTHTEKVFARWASFWARRVDQDTVASPNGFAGALGYYRRLAAGEFEICDQGPAPWRSIGPSGYLINENMSPLVGIVNAIAVHPTDQNTIYIGCNFSGVWKSTNGGASWVNKTDALRLPLMAVQSLAIDPSHPNTIFAGTGLTAHNGVGFGIGLFKSTDGGDTWVQKWPTGIAYTSTVTDVNVIRLHPNYGVNQQIVMAGDKRIMRSTDSGNTWTEVYNTATETIPLGNQIFTDLEYLPGNPNVMMASTRSDHKAYLSTGVPNPPMAQLLVSLDAGASWNCISCSTAIDPALLPCDRYAIAPSQSEGALCILYKSWGNIAWNVATIAKTWDGVQFKKTKNARLNNFNVTANADFGPPNAELMISPYDTNRIYIGGTGFYRYNANTNIFERTSGLHVDIRCSELRCASPSASDMMWLGTDGGPVSVVDNAQQFFSLATPGLAIADFYGFDFYPEDGRIVAGAQDNGVSVLEQPGWAHRRGGDGAWIEIDGHNSEYAVSGSNFIWTRNLRKYTTTINVDEIPTDYMPLPLGCTTNSASSG